MPHVLSVLKKPESKKKKSLHLQTGLYKSSINFQPVKIEAQLADRTTLHGKIFVSYQLPVCYCHHCVTDQLQAFRLKFHRPKTNKRSYTVSFASFLPPVYYVVCITIIPPLPETLSYTAYLTTLRYTCVITFCISGEPAPKYVVV